MIPQTKSTGLAALALVAVAVQGAKNDGIFMEPPVLPQVTNVSLSGSGCPLGTANVSWSSASWSDWIVTLHDLNLEAIAVTPGSTGGGSSRPPSESSCTIRAEFSHASPGWQLALEAVSIRGYAALSSGSSISAEASVSWSSVPATSNAVAPTAAAPVERNVSLTNSRPTDEASAMGAILDFSSVPAWSDCSASTALGSLNLNFKFGVHVQPNATGAYAAFGGLVDDGHGEISDSPAVTQRLQWTWRQCKPQTAIMGSTTFFPKPKTTTKATGTTTAAMNSTTTSRPFPPFSNLTSVTSSHPTSTWTTTTATTTKPGVSSSSPVVTTSKSQNTTVPKMTTTTSTHVYTSPTPIYFNTTTTTNKGLPTTLSTVTTSTLLTTNRTTSGASKHWTTSSTSEHWTPTTTALISSTDRITGSTWTTSVTGTSFSFSFIEDPPTETSTTVAKTTAVTTSRTKSSVTVTTTSASGFHNHTTPASGPTSVKTSTGTWTNSNSTGSTSRPVVLPTHS